MPRASCASSSGASEGECITFAGAASRLTPRGDPMTLSREWSLRCQLSKRRSCWLRSLYLHATQVVPGMPSGRPRPQRKPHVRHGDRPVQRLTRDTIEICVCCLFSSHVFMSFLQPLGFVIQTANSRRTFGADIPSNDGSFLARRISWAPKQMVRNQLVELREQHAKSPMKFCQHARHDWATATSRHFARAQRASC